MLQLLLFIWLVITSMLAAIGGWYAHGILGAVICMPNLYLWLAQNVHNSIANKKNVPDWMLLLAGEPDNSKSKVRYFLMGIISEKFISFLLTIAFATTGTFIAHFKITYLVVLVFTWVVGIVTIELYFKNRIHKNRFENLWPKE